MSAIQEKASKLQEYLVKTRRHLHENPESSLKEFETAAFIQKELTSFGVPFEKVGETGTLDIIKGGKGDHRWLRYMNYTPPVISAWRLY